MILELEILNGAEMRTRHLVAGQFAALTYRCQYLYMGHFASNDDIFFNLPFKVHIILVPKCPATKCPAEKRNRHKKNICFVYKRNLVIFFLKKLKSEPW